MAEYACKQDLDRMRYPLAGTQLRPRPAPPASAIPVFSGDDDSDDEADASSLDFSISSSGSSGSGSVNSSVDISSDNSSSNTSRSANGSCSGSVNSSVKGSVNSSNSSINSANGSANGSANSSADSSVNGSVNSSTNITSIETSAVLLPIGTDPWRVGGRADSQDAPIGSFVESEGGRGDADDADADDADVKTIAGKLFGLLIDAERVTKEQAIQAHAQARRIQEVKKLLPHLVQCLVTKQTEIGQLKAELGAVKSSGGNIAEPLSSRPMTAASLVAQAASVAAEIAAAVDVAHGSAGAGKAVRAGAEAEAVIEGATVAPQGQVEAVEAEGAEGARVAAAVPAGAEAAMAFEAAAGVGTGQPAIPPPTPSTQRSVDVAIGSVQASSSIPSSLKTASSIGLSYECDTVSFPMTPEASTATAAEVTAGHAEAGAGVGDGAEVGEGEGARERYEAAAATGAEVARIGAVEVERAVVVVAPAGDGAKAELAAAVVDGVGAAVEARAGVESGAVMVSAAVDGAAPAVSVVETVVEATIDEEAAAAVVGDAAAVGTVDGATAATEVEGTRTGAIAVVGTVAMVAAESGAGAGAAGVAPSLPPGTPPTQRVVDVVVGSTGTPVPSAAPSTAKRSKWSYDDENFEKCPFFNMHSPLVDQEMKAASGISRHRARSPLAKVDVNGRRRVVAGKSPLLGAQSKGLDKTISAPRRRPEEKAPGGSSSGRVLRSASRATANERAPPATKALVKTSTRGAKAAMPAPSSRVTRSAARRSGEARTSTASCQAKDRGRFMCFR